MADPNLLDVVRAYRDSLPTRAYDEVINNILVLIEGEPTREVVHCDDECGAFDEPVSLAETKHALDHWMDHSTLAGCSHGC